MDIASPNTEELTTARWFVMRAYKSEKRAEEKLKVQKSGTSICIEAPDFFLCILYIRIRNMYNYGSSGVILRPLYILE